MLNWNIATKPFLLIVMGWATRSVYYFLFRCVIRRWNLRTPGREKEGEESLVMDLERPRALEEGLTQGAAHR